MSYSRKIETSGAVQLISGSGVIDLSASSHVSANEIQLSTPLAMSSGGLGANYADSEAIRAGLGLEIGSDVQAYSAKLGDVAGLAPSSGDYIKWDGSNFVADVPAGTVYTADDSTLQLDGSEFSVKNQALLDLAGSTPESGQVLKYNGSNWAPASDSNNVYTADDSTLQVVANEFSIKNQALLDIAGIAGASSGHVIKYDGSNWVADADNDTTYSAGNGLALNTGAFSVDNTVVAVISGSVAQTITGTKTFSAPIVAQSNITQQNSGHSGKLVRYNYESQSTDDTQFSLATISMDVDAVTFLEAFVTVCSDDLAESASFKVFGVAKNVGGTASSLSLQDEIIYRSDVGIACVLDVFDTSDLFRIRCTGLAGTNLRWNAFVKYQIVPKYA